MQASSFEDLPGAFQGECEPVYMRSFEEIGDYFKDLYGEKKWKPRLADALHPFVEHEKPVKDPRAAALRAIQRAAKGDYKSLSPKYQEALRKLGQTLDPLQYNPPPGGFQVDFDGYVLISDECEKRSFSEEVTGPDAFDLANNPSFAAVMTLYFPADLVVGPCGEWTVNVTPLEGDGGDGADQGENGEGDEDDWEPEWE